MKIGVLTSSRADFGIYVPLLKRLQSDSFFQLQIIAFGTHLSDEHGQTITEIKEEGFSNILTLKTMPDGDSPQAIAQSMGMTMMKFSEFWEGYSFDLVFALGDRYEMFSAVSAASPFGIPFAHLHAGETTLGAIDNAYRHAISLFSSLLFVSTELYAKRAKEIVKHGTFVYNVGALSIDNLKEVKLLDHDEFLEKFNIDLKIPTILSTIHPETVGFERNEAHVKEFIEAIRELSADYQVVVTLPNADTMGGMMRDALQAFLANESNIHLVESFGMRGYLSCMKNCSFLLGNTSSGFVEASYFPKYVINLGERQKGRLVTDNIINSPITKESIISAVKEIKSRPELLRTFPYGKGDTANKIVEILKKFYEN